MQLSHVDAPNELKLMMAMIEGWVKSDEAIQNTDQLADVQSWLARLSAEAETRLDEAFDLDETR